MDVARILGHTVKLRKGVNKRNAEVKNIGIQVKGLLEETHNVIVAFSSKLGSTFGMDEVKKPPPLKEILPTAIPANPADLKRILDTIRLQVIYDAGKELDMLRKDLRHMEIEFDKTNLDQYLGPVEEEESLEDRVGDPAFDTIWTAIIGRIEDQAAAINDQLKFFRENLNMTQKESRDRREEMEWEGTEALRVPLFGFNEQNLDERIESLVSKALQGRDLHEVNRRIAFLRRIRGLLFPLMAKPALDIFEKLDRCVEEARRLGVIKLEPSTN